MKMSCSRFRQVRSEDLPIIMNWRMSPEITAYMCTDPVLTIHDQEVWYERIKKEEDSFYWIFEYQGKPAGLVSLVDWDKRNSIIHSGSYIANHEARGLQNIIDMSMNLLAYPFEKLGINKVAIEIMSNNIGQLRWVLRFGAKKEGILRQAILKNGIYYDLHIFSMLAEEWPSVKKKVHFNQIEIEDKK